MADRYRPTVVVTGIASRIGRMVARELHESHHVIGLDARGARHMPRGVTVHEIDLRRKAAEDVFRRNRIDAVIHLPNENPRSRQGGRRSSSVEAAQRLFDFCQKYDVPSLVVVSSAAVYGPSPDNSQFLTEDAALLAGQRFSTMRELVEIDMYASTFFWRHPEVDTVILRPVHLVGRLNNAASRYLRLRWTPVLMGFDPMVQVMAPEDLMIALHRAMRPGMRGIFNVAGPKPAPLSALIHRIGHTPVSVPGPLAIKAISLASGTRRRDVPREELDYLRFVCMVDDSRARGVLGYENALDLNDTLEPLRG